MAMVTTLFFVWGFLTVLNDILVPHLKAIFELSYTGVMLVQFSFFIAYFVLALPSGRIVRKIGYQHSMITGLVTMGSGALALVFAAGIPSYPCFLVGLFVLAAGMTILQVSANPYVAVLGTEERASSRLNLAQAFNSLGTALAPWVGGLLILSGTYRPAGDAHGWRLAEASSVKTPYLLFAAALLLLAVVVWRFRLPVLSAIESSAPTDSPVRSTWRERHLILGAVGIFVYCGAEVSIGSFLVSFFTQPDIGGLSEKIASHFVSYYWTGTMIGRFVGSALLRRIPAGRLLAAFATIAAALVWCTIAATGHVAMWSIISVGLFNSIMFPNIFALAIDGLGTRTSQASGILIMGILGAAVIPVAQGALADRFGIHHAFVLPALCYLYVVFYGLSGCHHRLNSDTGVIS
jgi:FHS family L-fucose permease-like MFS transporter